MTIEFQAWPKTPRLFREIVITEKVNGTNSAVIIREIHEEDKPSDLRLAAIHRDGRYYEVAAQSRNRLIFPGKTTDNYGFAAFIQHNAEALFDLLGAGRHYGEWWGDGIQGQKTISNMRGFALFNTDKHGGMHEWLKAPDGRDVLVEPVWEIYRGPFSEERIQRELDELKKNGSYMNPTFEAEGICVFHTQSRQVYKYTIEGDDAGKWEQK